MSNKYFYDFEFLEGTQDKTFMGIKYGKTLPTIQPISIGMVSEDGCEYYAIFNDFNLREAWNRFDLDYGSGDQRNLPPRKVYWIRENVLFPIYYELCLKENSISVMEYGNYNNFIGAIKSSNNYKYVYKNLRRLIAKYGKSTKQIANEIIKFTNDGIVETIGKSSVQLTSQEQKNIRQGYIDINLYGYYSAYDHVCLCWLFGKMIDLPDGFPMLTLDLKQMFDYAAKNLDTNSFFTGHDFSGKEMTDTQKITELKKHIRYPQQHSEHSAICDAHWNKELYEFIKTIN